MNIQDQITGVLCDHNYIHFMGSKEIGDELDIKESSMDLFLRDMYSSGQVMSLPGIAGANIPTQWCLPCVYYDPDNFKMHRRWIGRWEPPVYVKRAQREAKVTQ